MKINKVAFTLVELIVVITILAILATIGFVSFSSYLAGTRDTNRIAQLKSMSDALELYRAKKKLPIPDDKIDIKTNSETIAYQGYIGKNVLETIEYTESGLDPKYKEYFSYYLTKNKKYFQLMAFLEKENKDIKETAMVNIDIPFMGNLNAIDYSDKYPFLKGKKLGILTGTGTKLNTPIQEILSGSLNIENTTETYVANIDNNSQISGTGSKLKILSNLEKSGGKILASCKNILDDNSNYKNKDGVYLINTEGNNPFQVYCDMTTDGGGWTLISSDNDSGNWKFEIPLGLNERAVDFNSKIKATELRHYLIVNDIHRDIILKSYGNNGSNEIQKLVNIITGYGKEFYSDTPRSNTNNNKFNGILSKKSKNINFGFNNIDNMGIVITENNYTKYLNHQSYSIGRACIYINSSGYDCLSFGYLDDTRLNGSTHNNTNTRRLYTFVR